MTFIKQKFVIEQFLKSVKRFSDKNCGKNKKIEQSVEPQAKPKLL